MDISITLRVMRAGHQGLVGKVEELHLYPEDSGEPWWGLRRKISTSVWGWSRGARSQDQPAQTEALKDGNGTLTAPPVQGR